MTVAAATGSPDILPTHTCFDDAIDFFNAVGFFDHLTTPHLERMQERFRIVHGVCVGHAARTHYAHGWVEESSSEELVWQAGTLRATAERCYWALPRAAFYELFQVLEARVTKYTLPMAAEMLRTQGFNGPWRQEYRALCNDTPGGRIVGSMSGIRPLAVLRVHGGSR